MIKEARWFGWVWVGESSFWYRPTRVVPDQRPLNGRCCCCFFVKKSCWAIYLPCIFLQKERNKSKEKSKENRERYGCETAEVWWMRYESLCYYFHFAEYFVSMSLLVAASAFKLGKNATVLPVDTLLLFCECCSRFRFQPDDCVIIRFVEWI